ncbi:sugar phosphate isomerase/epimerase family protein [Mucisphaera calidilacus]|uniref:Fructoselysine 3-epimerase n=1 Tax=Mucisphaera calidilacus TaxID=2527982 RepID=A0A518BWV9_9BACT|nr:sugar phosphate isomerase/epimerase family protein [Mucisphaera calidilacus]QDU71463.1 fructoselysine 3-epimerase [Mucisphaera calidilacus]
MIAGISYWSLKQGLENTHPLDQALAEAQEAGFSALELCVGPEGVVRPDLTDAECRVLRQQIEGSSLTVETLASGMSWGFNPTSDDASVREKAIELHSGALRVAGALGLKALLFVPGVVKSPISPDLIRYDHAVERAREAVSRLLPVAEEAGVDLLIENVWNGLFYSPLELCSFVDGFDHPRLGVYFDAGNLLGYHQHPPHWIEVLAQRIRRVHVKDFKQSVGSLDGFCDLLDGDMPWAETMAALRAIGYSQTIVAEMIPHSDGLLERTASALSRILSM